MGLTAPYTQWTNDPTVVAMQTNYVMQVPFPAMATASDYTSWQANDPLVHYLASDLTFTGTEANNGPTTGVNLWTSLTAALPRPSFNVVNDRYQPWGANASVPQHRCKSRQACIQRPVGARVGLLGFPDEQIPDCRLAGARASRHAVAIGLSESSDVLERSQHSRQYRHQHLGAVGRKNAIDLWPIL